MITIYNAKGEVDKTVQGVTDYRQLLQPNQFQTVATADAKKALAVLGTNNASIRQIHWHRGEQGSKITIYNDWVVTLTKH